MIFRNQWRDFLLTVALCLLSSLCRAQTLDNATQPTQVVRELSQYNGRIIRGISFSTWMNLEARSLRESLGIEPGQPFDETTLLQGIARIKERNVFADVHPEVQVLPDGVNLQLVLAERKFIAEIVFSQHSALDEERLRRMLGIRPGTPFEQAIVEEGVERLKEQYKKFGFYQVRVETGIEQKAVPAWLTLKLSIREGPRSEVEKIELVADLPADVSFLREKLENNGLGLTASEENIELLKRELLLALRREGYLEASVELGEAKYAALSGHVSLKFSAKTGEPIAIIFSGNKHFSDAELLAPLKMESRAVPFAPGALNTLVREIRKLYQARGYYRATAEVSPLGVKDRRKIFQIAINEGEVYRISQILFLGNNSLPVATLQRMVGTKAAGWGFFRRWQPGYLVGEQVVADLEEIRVLYAEKGFYDSAVDEEIVVDEEERELAVTFKIQEGPQRVISAVDLQWKRVLPDGGTQGPAQKGEGQQKIDPTEPLHLFPKLQVGTAFNRDQLRQEQRRLYEEVVAAGFPNANVELEGDATTGVVKYLVTPGQRIHVGRIVFQGNILTRDYVLERELRFSEGGLLNGFALEESKQELSRLGYFRRVDIEPLDGKLDQAIEDIAVIVSERETGGFEVGVSLSSEDGLHPFGELRQRNYLGTGARTSLGADAYLKTGKELLDAGQMRAGVVLPRLQGSKWELNNEAYIQSAAQFVEQFSYDRIGASVVVASPVTEKVRGFFGPGILHERVFDAEPDIIIGENDTGTTLYSFLQSGIELDFRNDPYNPRRGFRSALTAEVTSRALGAEVDYYKLDFEQSILAELAADLLWANRGVVQYLDVFGGTAVVPLSRRVFLGGNNSLRGFSKYTVGPRGELGNVLGGDFGVNASSELRYSLADELQVLVFLDLGQSYLFNEGTTEEEDLGVEDMRFSPGLGVHYVTPIGPLRAEYGQALNRDKAESFGRFNVSIGSAF